tara:strand:- start:368 stop:910 length:543 start_codon:yes stop_codon:yes gene_type:complete
MYFKNFPKIDYSSTGNTNDEKLVTHLLKRVAIKAGLKEEMLMLDDYSVRAGDTPEIIASKHFGSPLYHWVILITNQITDRYFDWPMTEPQFEAYLKDKYGANIDSAHHYEITQTSGPTTSTDDSHLIQVNSTTTGALIVTNREYEVREQDKKRRIKLLDAQYLNEFVEEFKKIMRSAKVA